MELFQVLSYCDSVLWKEKSDEINGEGRRMNLESTCERGRQSLTKNEKEFKNRAQGFRSDRPPERSEREREREGERTRKRDWFFISFAALDCPNQKYRRHTPEYLTFGSIALP